VLSDWMVFKDPPDHSRLRNPVKRAFTPRAVQALTGQIESVVDHVLDLPASGEVDVIAAMLGVPPEDRDLFRGWSNEVSTLSFEGSGPTMAAPGPKTDWSRPRSTCAASWRCTASIRATTSCRPSSRSTTAVKR
jgi:cytochrome P450